MENEEDVPTSYLNIFPEGPHNYLLHTSEEEVLNDGFAVESIFTDMQGSEWSTEGFPILLSAPLISTSDNESNNTATDEAIEDNDHNKVTYFSHIDQNGLILSNDSFLQVENRNTSNDKTVTHVINGDTYAITYSQEEPDAEDNNVEVIQLMDVDGSVTSIDKNVLHTISNKNVEENAKEIDFSNFYTEVMAKKCKFCALILATNEEIVDHIKEKHLKNIETFNDSKSLLITNKSSDNGAKTISLLNKNKENEKFVMYLCSDCGNAYSSKEDLKQHMVDQHNFRPVLGETQPKMVPPNPDSQLGSKNQNEKIVGLLQKQQKRSHRVKCTVKGCTQRFAKAELRERHEECHNPDNSKQFVCPVCKEKFSIWRICASHLWKKHSIDAGMLSCPMCNDFKSLSTIKILNHSAIHNEEKPFLCNTCAKGFKQLTQLRNHEVIHKSAEQMTNCYTMKQCDSCDRVFANAKSLRKHIKFVHEKFKPFICNICGHQAARKEMLQVHYRQHTGDKPYHCNYCEYKTADRNCLRRHTMRHLGVAKYSCQYCDYKSIQSSSYKLHLANKHPGQSGSHLCSICKYTTVNIDAYSAHIKCHQMKEKNDAVKEKDAGKEANGKMDAKSGTSKDVFDDEETKSSFFNTEHSEDAVDTGGITIPAEFDLQFDE